MTDYLSVGAAAVQVYTALHTDMFGTLRRILEETDALLEEYPNSLSSLVGRSLRMPQ